MRNNRIKQVQQGRKENDTGREKQQKNKVTWGKEDIKRENLTEEQKITDKHTYSQKQEKEEKEKEKEKRKKERETQGKGERETDSVTQMRNG